MKPIEDKLNTLILATQKILDSNVDAKVDYSTSSSIRRNIKNIIWRNPIDRRVDSVLKTEIKLTTSTVD